MDTTTLDLIKLIQELIYGTTHDFQVTNQEKLYKQAKDNGLSGSLYEVLQHHVDVVIPSFQKDFYLYVAHDQKQLSMIDLVTTLFNDNDIDYKLLKGSIMKPIYPKTYYRSMGDVDILVRVKDLDKVHTLLIERGFLLDQGGSVHNHFTYGDLELEIHKRLRQEEKYKEFEILDHIWEDDTYLEMELLFLIFHLKKHLVSGGIGLRSVIDISLYIEHHLKSLDFNKFNTLLEQTNSTTFFHQLIMCNDQYLGKKLKDTLQISADFNNELYEAFTKYIVISGIHGLGMSFNNYIGKLANDQNHGLSKKGSFIKQVFLPYNLMKYMYPTLLKVKILLPVAWVLRIFKVLFKNTKRFLIRLKLYKVDQKTIDETSSLFHQMGIS
jgi:hypothetical protein